ncbi:hypothetical protein PIB19_21095 [Sphingomonas sp. 7/4-4]|uniref:hypothetical protein n=1 Tax=Sphingomonas sp. 7/4-4 TaxID=3018446 RepID=UPI0022F3BBDE|nr:hypothetical protein [Sphingomonas sp. 7/4-4]WBY07749.1 hypothetical protein PIB19_21095 [Sphingomonas sp. 7/4-4]
MAVQPARADKTDGPQDQQPQTADDIVVYGPRLGVLPGVPPENELNEGDIAAYGANSVGDLLDQVGGAADASGEGPVVLINGRETSGLNTINDLPTEAIRKIQVLPRRVAGRLGERPTRRVINVVLKNDHRQITGNAEEFRNRRCGAELQSRDQLVAAEGRQSRQPGFPQRTRRSAVRRRPRHRQRAIDGTL